MKKMFFFTVLILLAVSVLTACNRQDEAAPIRLALTIDASNPVAGEAASRALAQAMEDFIGIPVEPMPDISYLIGIEAMRSGHLDIMLVSAFNYIRTSAVVDVELLVTMPIRAGTVNNAVFITCASRYDINTLADLEGKTFAFVDAVSTTGYIFPKYHLVTNLGLNPNLIMTSGYFFDTATFSGGHETNVFGVSFGDFDAAAIGGIFLENMEERGLIYTSDFKVISYTEPVPSPSYIIRSAIDPELIEKIREFFLQFNDPAYFAENWGDGNIRFTQPDIEGYAHVRSIVQTLGLD
ncbi:MAG: phosphate/phosphite/phosphonate ABC transporter substrate-binding protein [Firmicutes bacterium]|nr:phosphate/phosphite/phosphonate ABC transporter substrate-binding protein [Bacillota bacterium]